MTDFILTRDWLAARAAISPTALALIEPGGEWTYGQLDTLVSRTVFWLRGSGVAPGDHVAVLLPNCLAYVVLIHALTRVGAILVPLNTRLRSAEIADQVARSDCRFLIRTSGLATDSLHETPVACEALWLDEQLVDLRAQGATPANGKPAQPDSLNEMQAIVFTSGTTGRPKGAMLTYANHYHGAIGSAFRLGVMPSDRWLACMPLYHVGGLAIILRACLYGTAVVLQDGFAAERVDSSLRQQDVTLVSLVPTMLHRLLDMAEPRQWTALRLILLGGAAAPVELLHAARDAGLAVATTYGLTEAASQVATMPSDLAAEKLGCVGQPLLFTQVRIADESNATVDTGAVGEVCVRGPSVFAGYYGDVEATAQTLREGELHTGDLGFLDPDGDLWIVQRRSDLIVSGGENVYPAEVEAALVRHPAVSDACVVGLADAEWGQRVAALVVCEGPATAGELIAFAKASLAGYKVPRTIHFTKALPLTGSGKVSRSAAIDLLESLKGPVS